MNLGDTFPNFEAKSTLGEIKFYDWIGDSWGIIFSHPSDFTPVCTTELARVCQLFGEFQKRNIKVIALSCDTVQSHHDWINDIKKYGNDSSEGFPYPIIADPERKLASQFGMLDPNEIASDGMPVTCRAVFIIDENKKLRLSILYPATTGRNFDEIIRVIDSLQLTEQFKVATPVDWKKGDECMIQPTVSDEDAMNLFPKGYHVINVPSEKKYLRVTSQPPH